MNILTILLKIIHLYSAYSFLTLYMSKCLFVFDFMNVVILSCLNLFSLKAVYIFKRFKIYINLRLLLLIFYIIMILKLDHAVIHLKGLTLNNFNIKSIT